MSVIVPCYNAAPYVARTLNSLRRQTLQDWDCVVVDDGSTDASAQVVQAQISDDARIRLLRQTNQGVSRARNAGFAAVSESEYLLFLDADDCLEPTMLERLSHHLDAEPSVGLVYCAFTCVDELDRPIHARDPRYTEIRRYVPTRFGVRTLDPEITETPFKSVFGVWAGLLPSTSLLRRLVYAMTPGWDDELGQPSEDTDLFLHMALYSRVHYLAEPLVAYRRHATQSTRNSARLVTQDRKLYRKWAAPRGFDPEQLTLIADARQFREARLMPLLWLRYGADHLRNGHWVEAAKCSLRSVRQFGAGLAIGARGRSPAAAR